MSGYLLDTNVVLLSQLDDPRVSDLARRAMRRGPNFISVASNWEVTIKTMKGKLDVGDPRTWWSRTLYELNALPLQILPRYIQGLLDLPPIHQDPFDRMIVASAIAESLTLLTTDREIARYASERLVVNL